MIKNFDAAVVFATVKRAMDKHDLESLRKMGAPNDEYGPESQAIAAVIRREGPVTSIGLARAIRLVLHYHFHSWTNDKMPALTRYMSMAWDIWKALPSEYRRP
jgi:hypothetical protein